MHSHHTPVTRASVTHHVLSRIWEAGTLFKKWHLGFWHLETHLRAERPPAKRHGIDHVLVTLAVTAVGRWRNQTPKLNLTNRFVSGDAYLYNNCCFWMLAMFTRSKAATTQAELFLYLLLFFYHLVSSFFSKQLTCLTTPFCSLCLTSKVWLLFK